MSYLFVTPSIGTKIIKKMLDVSTFHRKKEFMCSFITVNRTNQAEYVNWKKIPALWKKVTHKLSLPQMFHFAKHGRTETVVPCPRNKFVYLQTKIIDWLDVWKFAFTAATELNFRLWPIMGWPKRPLFCSLRDVVLLQNCSVAINKMSIFSKVLTNDTWCT